MTALLEVEGLTVRFPQREGIVHAVTDVSFAMQPGRVLTLMGESGSGKTTVALSVLGLLPYPGEMTGGTIRFQGRDLSTLTDAERRAIRGDDMSMVFQDPVAGLNPLLTVGRQIEEVLSEHTNIPKKEARRRVIEVMRDLGIPRPEHAAGLYPFEISGGMAQRVMIGMATILDPKLLIADEPTTSLDVTVQAMILEELRRLRDRGAAILLITHDLGVVAQVADDMAVMYGGRIVEYGDVDAIFRAPRHPYTFGLMSTLPRVDGPRERLPVIPGNSPTLIDQGDECPFLDRCPKARSVCRTDPFPAFEEVEPGHFVACYNQMLDMSAL